jgi:hypothetical protein
VQHYAYIGTTMSRQQFDKLKSYINISTDDGRKANICSAMPSDRRRRAARRQAARRGRRKSFDVPWTVTDLYLSHPQVGRGLGKGRCAMRITIPIQVGSAGNSVGAICVANSLNSRHGFGMCLFPR